MKSENEWKILKTRFAVKKCVFNTCHLKYVKVKMQIRLSILRQPSHLYDSYFYQLQMHLRKKTLSIEYLRYYKNLIPPDVQGNGFLLAMGWGEGGDK